MAEELLTARYATVQKATGRTWDEWFELLDQDGAMGMPHPQVAKLLAEKYGLSGWWSQSVTVTYEQARGLRAKHEKADGFAISVSRTFDVPLESLFAACENDAERDRWLPGAPLQASTVVPPKAVRGAWLGENGGRVDLTFGEKDATRSRIAVQHTKLGDSTAAAAQKLFWKDALERLARRLRQAD